MAPKVTISRPRDRHFNITNGEVVENVENAGKVVNVIYPFKMVKIPLFWGKITTSNCFMTQKS